jgi:methylenetetrahydrofolate reductase (NADPH)
MQVLEHLERATRPLVSVEIIPPKRGGNIQQLYRAVESVIPFHPPFIDVTSHAAEIIWEELPDGSFKRRVKRKSPGTFGLCAAIKYKFNVDPVPHLLCNGFTREETEDALIELNYLGVENVLLVRGDSDYRKPLADGKTANVFAADLVSQVADMNRGRYLDTLIDALPAKFCIGVSAYPEKHFEAPSMGFDIDNLKRKQTAGAHYAVTQLFYDNAKYFSFVEQARAAGVTIPILPGLKILTRKAHLNTIPSTFFLTMPDELVDRVMHAADDAAVAEVGIEWAYQQALSLLDHGSPALHFYIMQLTSPFVRLMQRLQKHL